MKTKFKLAAGSVAVALALAGISPAGAAVFSVTLGTGVSKDFQNDPVNGDLSSKFGATVAGSTISFNTATGEWTVDLKNSGAGVVTSFALSLNETLFPEAAYNASGYVFTPISCDAIGGGDTGCDFSDDSYGSLDVDGFEAGGGGDFDIGASADPPPSKNGLESGLVPLDEAEFTWAFTLGSLGDLSTVDDFFDLVNPLSVPNPSSDCDPGTGTSSDCKPFNAFWVAHVQELGDTGDDSDHIGGSRGTIVPEPGALLLLGIGLAAAGWARRKRA